MPLDHSDFEPSIEDATIVDNHSWASVEELHNKDERTSAEKHDARPADECSLRSLLDNHDECAGYDEGERGNPVRTGRSERSIRKAR